MAETKKELTEIEKINEALEEGEQEHTQKLEEMAKQIEEQLGISLTWVELGDLIDWLEEHEVI